MVKDLGAKTKRIEFPVYGRDFAVELTTKKIEEMIKTGDDFQARSEEIGEKDWSAQKEELINVFDAFLGEGTGQFMFEQVDDVLTQSQTFLNICEFLSDSMEEFKKEEDRKKGMKVIAAKKSKKG